MLDHHGPLEHGPNPYRLPVHHGVEAAADLMVEGGNDGGERDQFSGAAHVF